MPRKLQLSEFEGLEQFSGRGILAKDFCATGKLKEGQGENE